MSNCKLQCHRVGSRPCFVLWTIGVQKHHGVRSGWCSSRIFTPEPCPTSLFWGCIWCTMMSHWHDPNICPDDVSLHSDLLNSIRKNRRISAPLKMNNPGRLAASVYLRAVHIEPPVADEVLLVEDRPVGAEEAVLGESTATIIAAYVERLALGLRIGVVAFTKCANVCWDREVGCKHLGCSPRRQNWCREVERILGNQRPLSQELIPLKNRDEIIYNNRKDFFIG